MAFAYSHQVLTMRTYYTFHLCFAILISLKVKGELILQTKKGKLCITFIIFFVQF